MSHWYSDNPESIGNTPLVEADRDKPCVVALREIAAGLVDNEFVAQEDVVVEEPIFAAFEDEANEAV